MAHKLPPEAYHLAETYQLGTPVRRHTGWLWVIVSSSTPACFFLLIAVLTVGSFTSPDMHPSATLIVPLIVDWIAWGILAAVTVKRWGPYAYECTGGFVVLTRRTRQVSSVLHWNEVLNIQTTGGRWKTYSVTDIHQRTIELQAPDHLPFTLLSNLSNRKK